MDENTVQVIISLIIAIIEIAGMWKIFQKAGVPGWHAIIPILNVYDLCKIALYKTDADKKNVIIFTILCVFIPVVIIYPYIKLAERFGKSAGFGVLTFFFSFVCIPILGFGKAEYDKVEVTEVKSEDNNQ